MQREVVTPRELPLTLLTLERLGAGVFAKVSRQFVGAREFPRASLPRARVRFLAGMRPHVGLEMGALGVDLAAAGVLALVYLFRR